MKMTFQGGLNENDGTLMEECQRGYNFELVYGDSDLRPRKPLDLKTSSFVGSVNGIMKLIKRDNTETTLVFDADTPDINTWDGATTITAVRTNTLNSGSMLRDEYYSLDDVMVICDVAKLTPMLKWDGTTCDRLKTGLDKGSPQSVTSITRVGQVATVTTAAAHGYTSGDLVIHADAVETEYNIEAEITVLTTTTYTYVVAGSPTTPATGTITHDFGVELYAKYAIVHNSRLWLFNVTTNDGTASDTPHLMVASAFENIESYDTTARAEDGTLTGNEAFYILTPDLKPINGAVSFNKELVISTSDGKMYRLTGNDSTNYRWVDYYAGSAAIGTETMVNYGNDVAFMKKGGRIDTLVATDRSSDVSVDDISRWIPIQTKDLSDAMTVYDPDYQKVYFFVADKVLVLYKDILIAGGGQISPWSVYKTDLAFGFNTTSVKRLRRPGEASWSVYIGDNAGNIYDLNGVGQGDSATTEIKTVRRTRLIDEMDTYAKIIFGRITYRRIGSCQINLKFDWSNSFAESTAIITLKGPDVGDSATYYNDAGYYNGAYWYNEGFLFNEKVAQQNFSPSGRNVSFFMEASLTTLVDFKIDSITLDT